MNFPKRASPCKQILAYSNDLRGKEKSPNLFVGLTLGCLLTRLFWRPAVGESQLRWGSRVPRPADTQCGRRNAQRPDRSFPCVPASRLVFAAPWAERLSLCPHLLRWQAGLLTCSGQHQNLSGARACHLWASGGLEWPGALFWNPVRGNNQGQPIGKRGPHPTMDSTLRSRASQLTCSWSSPRGARPGPHRPPRGTWPSALAHELQTKEKAVVSKPRHFRIVCHRPRAHSKYPPSSAKDKMPWSTWGAVGWGVGGAGGL